MDTNIFLHGKAIGSVFELLGTRENDVTYSLGWALAQSPSLRRALLARVFPGQNLDAASVRLQERTKGCGITDIELLGPESHVIIEAKRGWQVPRQTQLELYLPRLQREPRPYLAFVTMSECGGEYARTQLPKYVGEVPVHHMAWHEVQRLAFGKAKTHAEGRLLQELNRYLERIVKMQDKESNWVLTVALNNSKPKGYGLTFKQIVLEKRMYFHPVNGKWSQEPVNYLGFRYDGRLQSIHHVEKWDVVTNMHEQIPEIDPVEWEPHYLYRLGPAIVPSKPVLTGKIWPTAPKRAMLDLLLTSGSVAEAALASARRLKEET